jgi:hypothetical protein
MTYFRHDAQNVLYNAFDTPLTADGDSNEIDFYRDGGVHPCEVAFNVADFETGESIVFTLYSYSYADAAWIATPYKISLTAAGEYILPIDNRMASGGKIRFAHDITLDTTSLDGIKVHAHVRPRAL